MSSMTFKSGDSARTVVRGDSGREGAGEGSRGGGGAKDSRGGRGGLAEREGPASSDTGWDCADVTAGAAEGACIVERADCRCTGNFVNK